MQANIREIYESIAEYSRDYTAADNLLEPVRTTCMDRLELRRDSIMELVQELEMWKRLA